MTTHSEMKANNATRATNDKAMPQPPAPHPEIEVSHQSPRRVIIHYHLFKNAGTSLDQILKTNFPNGWQEREGPGIGWSAPDVAGYLKQHPHIRVLSSHTALLPPPELPDCFVYPILFIRHPIDRIRSIYEFEVKQVADTSGARKAKETDLAGYIKWRLHCKGDRAIRNFQAYRIAFAVPGNADGKSLTEEERSLAALTTLPFVGVVETFDTSLQRLQEWLMPAFPHIDFKPVRANVTQKAHSSLDDRLLAIQTEVGAELFNELMHANALDLKLYKAATQARFPV